MSNKHNCSVCPYHRCQALKTPDIPFDNVDILFINEWPDTHDIQYQKTLQGPKGELLMKALHRAGGYTLNVMMASAMSCIPPKSEQKKKSIWEALEACYVDRLFDLIIKINPKVIVGFGANVVGLFLNDKHIKITQVSGLRQEIQLNEHTFTLIPSIKPSAVLHSPANLAYFEKALFKAIDVCGTNTLRKPPPTKYVVINASNVEQFLEKLEKVNPSSYSTDVETTGLDFISDKIILSGICWRPGFAAIFDAELIDHPKIKTLLSSPFMSGIYHNGKFDIQFYYAHGINATLSEDVILMHYALNETKGTHDLEQLAITYLGADPYEHDVKKYLDSEFGYRDAPLEVLRPYLAKDLDYTYQLFHKFSAMIDATPRLNDNDPGLRFLYEKILKPASAFYTEVERRGLSVDPIRLDAYEKELFEEKVTLENFLKEQAAKYWDAEQYQKDTKAHTVPTEFNPGASKQLAWLLYERMKLRPMLLRRTKDGQISTAEKVLKSINDPSGYVKALLDFRGIAKEHSTYAVGVRNQLRTGGVVRSTYIIYGTVTGRLASRKPNLQNIPRQGKAKSIFVARPGHVLIEVDYSQAELRVCAYLSGDPTLKQIYIDKRDLHDEMATAIFGADWTKEQRVGAKAINFGILYGLTAFSLERDLKLAHGEGQAMLDKWFETLPLVEAYIKDRRQAVVEGRVLVTPFGRRRRFGVITPTMLRALQNQATNFEIQSTATDLTLLSAMRIAPVIKQRHNAYILNSVHDSMLVEVPDNLSDITGTCKVVHNVMTRLPGRLLQTDIPFEIDFKKGYSWGEMDEYTPAL